MHALNVLMITMGDEVLTSWGDTRERHLEYAERINHLHIVMYSPAARGLKVTQVSDRLTAYPTRTRFRPLFPWEALRIGAGICRRQRIDVITTQDPFLTGLAGAWLSRRFGIPLDLQNHSDFFDNRHWIAEKPLRYGFFNWLGKRLLPTAQTHRVLNEIEKAKYVAMGIDAGRVCVLATPVRLGRFTPGQADPALRQGLGIPEGAPTLLWVGKPGPVKRVNVLVEAFRLVRQRHPEAHLILVGDFSGQMQFSTLTNIHLPGKVAHELLPEYYRACDIYVHSSVYEGLGKVMIEAAACARPVISTRTSGAAEIVQEGVTGLLCALEDPADMAARIGELLDDPERAAQMGRAGRAFVLAKFDHAKNLDAVVETWVRCAALRPGGG